MHYFGAAIVPPHTTYADAQDLAAKLLAPYDENLCQHYEETDGPCDCKGIWDWWVIGGRWTGVLSEYDPKADPANLESCVICGGTGKRERAGCPFALDWTDKKWDDWVAWSGGCNSCQGKGERIAFRLQPHEGDVAPVRYALNARLPYTVFCEHGVTGEFEYPEVEEEHQAVVRAHLELHHADEWLAVVDYHS